MSRTWARESLVLTQPQTRRSCANAETQSCTKSVRVGILACVQWHRIAQALIIVYMMSDINCTDAT